MVMPIQMSVRGPKRSVSHPLDRPEDAALGPRHRERHREQRLAPAEFPAEQHDVRAVRVKEERAHQRLEDEAGGDDPPAVEDPTRGHRDECSPSGPSRPSSSGAQSAT
jgi:hypothetical protein